MKAFRILLPLCLLSGYAPWTPAQPVLSIDFNERGQDPVATTFAGFEPFFIDATGSTTLAQTNPTIRVISGFTVTLSGNGPNPNYDDRIRSVPSDSGDFTQSLLLRDFVFNNSGVAGSGLNVAIEGLTAGQTYQVTLWSYDNGSTGNRISDWFAQSALVVANYTFNGSNLPTNNTQYQMTFKASATASGQLLIQGRRATGSSPTVFLNALQLEEATPDLPAITVDPVPIELYAGDNARFQALASGTAPLTYIWLQEGTPVASGPDSVLVVTNAQASDSGPYSVVVTNAAGSVTSSVAQLTVRPVANITSGLLAHWPLDTATDTTPDVSGSGNDLTLVGLTPANLVAGVRGNAFEFDGTTAMLVREHTNNSNLPLMQYPACTIALWVKGDYVGQSDRRVFSQSSATNNSVLLNIGTHSQATTNVADIFIRNDNGVTPINHVRSSLPAFDNTWHHLAWVDNNGLARLYVDGVQDTNNFNYTRGVMTPTYTTIGGILRSNASHWFAGQIDDVAMWRRSLSEAEVQQVMANGPVVPPIRITRIEITGGNVVLTIFSPTPAALHRIEQTQDVQPPSWTTVPDVLFSSPVGNEFTATFALPAGRQQFYRVAQP